MRFQFQFSVPHGRGFRTSTLARALVAAVAIFIFGLCGALQPICFAQLYSGSVTGVVTDSSGAVVANAKVTIIDVGKQYEHTATTGRDGRFLLRPLPPSTYRLIAEADGFAKYEHTGIVLEINANATIDVQLAVASVAQTTTVIATAPLLAAQDATTGQTVNESFIKALPLIGREVLDLTFLAPGVNPAPGNTYGSLGGEWYGNNFTSNGGRNASSDTLVDGVSASGNEQNGAAQIPLYTPSPDAVQEFKVEQNNFSADLGYSGNTVVNIVTRSGTNALHGSAYEYLRNSVLDAGNWFDNQPGSKKPGFRYNDFGVTVGGPIRKNKTFFFFDYEGNRIRANTGTVNSGVPSALERTANFGELCGYAGGTFDSSGMCSVAAGQIWDPYSGIYDPNQGGTVHQAIIPFNNMATYTSPGNPNLNGTGFQLAAVPGNLIDPVAAKIASYFPLPNNLHSGPGNSYNPYNNWAGSGTDQRNHDQIDARIDQQFNQKNILSGRFSWGRNPALAAQFFNNPLDPRSGGPSDYTPRMLALNDTHVLNQNTVISIAYGFTRVLHHVEGINAAYPGFDPVTSLGLPSYIETSGYKLSPAVIVGDQYANAGYGLSTIGAQPWSVQRYAQETHHLTGSLSHSQGRHEIKFGGEMRVHRVHSRQPGTPDGLFSFDHGATQQLPSGGSGDALASFLTGVGSGGWGQYEIPVAQSTQNFAHAAYALDNWKITNTLTVNLGLRYELEIPRTEKHDKMSWFDPSAASPISVPCLSGEPCLTNLKGGLVYAGVNGHPNHVVDTNYKGFAPRIGISWRVRTSTVIRTGYGIFYQPSEYGATGVGPAGIDGFIATTNWNQTFQGDGVTPWGRLSNPFPDTPHLTLPIGSSQGLRTELGTSVNGPIRSVNALPYTQTWSFGFQHQLPGEVLIDASYVGTKGTHLYFNGAQNLNHLGNWVKSASLAELANLQTYVNNPFYGVITDPNVPLSGPQIQLSQLYEPYPQFTGVAGSVPPIANSIYHSLQIRVEKRMSKGLQLLGNYVWSKSIDNASTGSGITWLSGGYIPTGLIDPNNPGGERSISQSDIPQVLNVAFVYQLPFGKGKSWGGNLNHFEEGALGGWQLSGTYRVDNGTPITLGEQGGLSLPGGYGQRPNLTANLRRNTASNWKSQYFANPLDAQVAQAYTLGNTPRFISSVRAPGTNTTSFAISKSFGLGVIHEGAALQFRAETFNALNHPQFCGPNGTVQYNPNPRVIDPNNPPSPVTDLGSFGLVSSQCNSPREVQAGLRLSW